MPVSSCTVLLALCPVSWVPLCSHSTSVPRAVLPHSSSSPCSFATSVSSCSSGWLDSSWYRRCSSCAVQPRLQLCSSRHFSSACRLLCSLSSKSCHGKTNGLVLGLYTNFRALSYMIKQIRSNSNVYIWF